MCQYYWLYRYARCGHSISASDMAPATWVVHLPCELKDKNCASVDFQRLNSNVHTINGLHCPQCEKSAAEARQNGLSGISSLVDMFHAKNGTTPPADGVTPSSLAALAASLGFNDPWVFSRLSALAPPEVRPLFPVQPSTWPFLKAHHPTLFMAVRLACENGGAAARRTLPPPPANAANSSLTFDPPREGLTGYLNLTARPTSESGSTSTNTTPSPQRPRGQSRFFPRPNPEQGQ